MRRILLIAAGVVLAAVIALYLFNASWWAAPRGDGLRIIAHRGIHQTFQRDGLTNETCTASRIDPPAHDLLENTIRSMRAAFAAGADIVELDVHPTTDGHFAVFHDWTLDCRTEGSGVTRERDLAYLKALDIGYGYTADGGATYPLRGKGRGQLPTLVEVFDEIRNGSFIVNFKSDEAREGDMLAALLARNSRWRDAVWGAYGGDKPTVQAAEKIEGLRVWTRRTLLNCLTEYLATGWTGNVPASCRNTAVMVPINYAWLLWGWPNLFQERMRLAGSEVILVGPYESGDPGTAGIDTADLFALVPPGFSGYVWTNRVELIGPLANGTKNP